MNNKYNKFKDKRGFSLIEALVILLVTAVLLAVVVPWLTVKKQTGGGEKWLYSSNMNIFLGTRDNSTNVGIGTQNPLARLHVVSAKRIIDDCGTDDCTEEGIRRQEKGADMILESTTRAPLFRFRANDRDVNFYLNSEVNNFGFGEESLSRNIAASGEDDSNDADSDYQRTQNNIALGYRTLQVLRDGTGNIAIGADVLRSLQFGSNNVALGSNAMASCNINSRDTNNNVSNNVVMASINSNNICGNSNVAIGRIQDINNRTNNVYLATTGLGDMGAQQLRNVFIGENIGRPTSANIGNATGTGAGFLNIGDRIHGRFSPIDGNFDQEELAFLTNRFIIRDATAPGILYYRQSVTASDVRLKKDIKSYKRSIEELGNLRTYNFFYKFDKKGVPMKVGIIAQDLKKVIPEAVSLNEDNRYVVDYSYINMAMVNAAKDIKKENDDLSAELDELEKQINNPSFKLCSCKKQTFFDKFLSFIRLK